MRIGWSEGPMRCALVARGLKSLGASELLLLLLLICLTSREQNARPSGAIGHTTAAKLVRHPRAKDEVGCLGRYLATARLMASQGSQLGLGLLPQERLLVVR